MDRNVNVYLHKRKTDGTVFYIGQGKNNRFKSSKGRNKVWLKIVKEHGFEYEILNENVSREEAIELEKKAIMFYGINNLCNMTLGGNGGDVVSFNIDRDEIRLKQKKNTLKGVLNPNYGGKLHTEDYLKKQSVSNSKVKLKCENIITGEIITALNSKELSYIIGAKPSSIRTNKKYGYLLNKKYKITNL